MFRTLERIKTWHFFLAAVLFSEIFTFVINSLQSILRWGVVSRELIEIGAIDAIFVSLFVTSILIPLIRYSTKTALERNILQNEIAERKQIEEALRESEESYRVLFNQDPLPGWVYDTESYRFLLVNDAAQKQYGYTSEEFLSMTIWEIRPSEDIDRLEKFLFEIKDRPAVSRFWRHRKKDGTFIDVEINSHPILFGGKKARRVIVHDITQRRKAEEALRASEEKFRSVFNNIGIGIALIGKEMEILSLNPQMRKWFPHIDERQHHLCYRSFNIPPRDAICSYCPTIHTLKDGQVHMSVTDTPNENEIRHYRIISTPLLAADGSISAAIEMVEDITELMRAEEERLKAQKLESIGTLAGGIAHDFNNLLQGIFGYISMAKMTINRREEALSKLEQAEEALHLSVDLTNQLLTFSKGGKPVKKLMRIGPAVSNAVKFALSGSRTNYEMDIPADLPSVEADEGQLSQVIQNIVLNANEAMAGSGTVRVSLETVDISKDTVVGLPNGGQFIRITIEDSGIGIPEQNLSRIFDPYFTTKQKGSGLGLATSYSIIKNHGGVIDVRSALNEGTTFTIYLPATGTKEDEYHEITASAPGRKGKILVMDDEEMVGTVATELIEALGHTAEYATDGEDAITKFRRARESGKPFDVVILDLTVKGGGMGGEHAIKKLRELDPDIKAIVSSGYADSPVVSDYQSYGFTAFLNKPYKIDSLRDTLDAMLL